MTVRTWQLEVFVVASVVFGVALFVGRGAVELVGAGAVVLSFAHGQVSDRLAEDAAVRDVITVDCYRWSTRYFVAKEVLWVVYFVALGAWSALAGCGLFLVYPFWRRWWRRQPKHMRMSLDDDDVNTSIDRRLNEAARSRITSLRDADGADLAALRRIVRLTGGWS